MKSGLIAVGLVVVVVCAGCASPVKTVDVNPPSPGGFGAASRGLTDFYAQPRSVDLLVVRGTNPSTSSLGELAQGRPLRRAPIGRGLLRAGMTVSYTGVTEYRVASILPPLNAIPREPGVLEKAMDGVCSVAKWGLGWYFGAQIADKAFEQPRTVSPEIVRPEIVTPEVITVPAGP